MCMCGLHVSSYAGRLGSCRLYPCEAAVFFLRSCTLWYSEGLAFALDRVTIEPSRLGARLHCHACNGCDAERM